MPFKVLIDFQEYELPDDFQEIIKSLKSDEVNKLNINPESFNRIQTFGTNYLKLDRQARKQFENPETITFEWAAEAITGAILPDLGADVCALGFDHFSNYICYKIAEIIKDKSIPEIRNIFRITNDYTPDEEAEITKQSCWT